MTFLPEVEESASPRRRRVWVVVAAVAVLVVVGAVGMFLLTGGDDDRSGTAGGASPTASPEPSPEPPALEGEVVALADRMFLTGEGRAVFAAAQPRLVGADEIGEVCAGAEHDGDGDGFVAGCFTGLAGSREADRIHVYRPGDERLDESMVTVAAHELLHAVYARFTADERNRVDELVAAEVARVPVDDPVHEQIDGSVGEDEGHRANEQFAYLGSQILLDDGFAPELEAIYAHTFADRTALVETHRRAVAVIDEVLAAVDAAWAEVVERERTNAHTRAQYDADRAAYEQAAASYDADVAEFEATAPEERERWTVTLTPPDAEPMTMSWEESLVWRGNDLERVRSELDARAAALAESEAAAADRRAETEALRADALALLRAGNPRAGIDEP